MYKIMPESLYPREELSLDKVREAYESGRTVTGWVKAINADNQVLIVQLGKDLFARLPFSEVTIYPFRYSKKSTSLLPTNIKCLYHRQIRAKIIAVNGNEIVLSRKKNMEQSYNHLCTVDHAKLFITQVIPKSVFGDIGDGLVGKMYVSEISKAHIQKASEYLHPSQAIDVVMLGSDEEMRFATSYRQTFPEYNPNDYPIGTIIKCKVGHWIEVADVSKYYMSVTPQVRGIMQINAHIYLDYGTTVECLVTGANEHGLFLDFIKELA